MSHRPGPPRGMRDLLPEAMRRKNWVCRTLQEVFEGHGFEPLDTPALEDARTLLGKYGPDAERLIYSAGLRGKDDLALRYDLTVPLARVAATTDALPLPFKRYQLGKVWRGERPQRGRYREITQADADIVGTNSMLADAEIIVIVIEALERLGFSQTATKINNRHILAAMGRYAGVEDELLAGLYRGIDKMDRVGIEGVRLELMAVGLPGELMNRQRQAVERWLMGTADLDRLRSDLGAAIPPGAPPGLAGNAVPAFLEALAAYPAASGLGSLPTARGEVMAAGVAAMRREVAAEGLLPTETVNRVLGLIAPPTGGGLDRLEELLSGQAAEVGFSEVRQVMAALEANGLDPERFRFDAAMVRGLDYYTGTIFETVVTDPPIGSITGGGRYDGLIKLFGRDLPAVGTSFGVDRLIEVLAENDGFPPALRDPITQVIVVHLDSSLSTAAADVARRLRAAGFRTELALAAAGVGDHLRHAARRGVPFIAIVGPDEAASGTLTLRDLEARTQQTVPLADAVEAVQAMV